MCRRTPTPSETEQQVRVWDLLRNTDPVEIAARLVQAEDLLDHTRNCPLYRVQRFFDRRS